jgi:hypothetical protein
MNLINGVFVNTENESVQLSLSVDCSAHTHPHTLALSSLFINTEISVFEPECHSSGVRRVNFLQAFRSLYASIIGREDNFEEMLYEAKKFLLDSTFDSELSVLATLLENYASLQVQITVSFSSPCVYLVSTSC